MRNPIPHYHPLKPQSKALESLQKNIQTNFFPAQPEPEPFSHSPLTPPMHALNLKINKKTQDAAQMGTD